MKTEESLDNTLASLNFLSFSLDKLRFFLMKMRES